MSELRRGTEQIHESDVQPNTPLSVDGPSGSLFDDDPVLGMAMLVELYVQDLTLLGLFCQSIAKYSYRVIYFNPELICKKDADVSSTSTAIRQLLNTAEDLSLDQLTEYTTILSSDLNKHREKLGDECKKLKEALAFHRSYDECLVRERIAVRYTKDIREIDALIRENGFCMAYPTLILNSNGKFQPYIMSTAVLQSLLSLLSRKQQCIGSYGKDLSTEIDSQSVGPIFTTSIKQHNDHFPPKLCFHANVPKTHKTNEVPTVLLAKGTESAYASVAEQSAQSFSYEVNLQSKNSHASTNSDDNEVDDLLAQLLSDDGYITVGAEAISSNLLNLQCDLIKSKGETSVLATQKEADSRKILELADEVKMLSASLDKKDERLAFLEQEFTTLSEHAKGLERNLAEQSAELATKRKEAMDNALRADEKAAELGVVSKELGIKLTLLKKAAAEIARLKELLTQKSDSIEFSTSKITELQNELEIKDAEIRRNENRIERLHKELTEKTDSLHTLKLMDTKMRHDLEEAKDGMERASSRTTELENMLAQKTLQLDRKSNDLTLLMEENTKFSAQIVALLNSTNSLKLEVEQLRLERNTSYGDIKRLSTELSQKEADLCDALKKLELESGKLAHVEELLSEKKMQLEKLTLDLTVKNSDIAKLTAESITKAEELSCKSETIQQLRGEISTLHDKLLDGSSSAARVAEVKELLTTTNDLKTKIYDLESLNTELQQDSERYKLEINRLSLALEEKDKPSTVLINTVEAKLRQEALVDVSQSGSHIIDISDPFIEKVEHMQTSWRHLQNVLDETEKEKQELVARLQDAQKLIETLHGQLKKSIAPGNDSNSTNHEGHTFERKVHALQDELVASKAKIKSLREALSSLKIAYKSLLENMNETTAILNEQTVREEDYKKKLAELTAEIGVLRALRASDDGALGIEALSHEYTVVNEELKRTTTELSQVQAALQQASAREEALLERLADAAAAVGSYTDHTVADEGKPNVAVTLEEAVQVTSITQDPPPQFLTADAAVNTDIPCNYRETSDVENEISGLHSTIATLTCELVQVRGECVLLKQQIQSEKAVA
ncbi:Coiled-coil protein [Giardia lamblia P15]|uniref:Coiled-coil protein n=1 Tax=Giardia intestinalis (strain P15) TaxID=658858 RepID=E1F2B7_GIAIA|nr:Coiled-coil protein [Giardia lamblia P15]